MEVRIGITREIIVDGQVDTLNINTSTEDISGDTDSLVEFLELLVTFDTIKPLDKGETNVEVVLTAPPG